MLCLSRVSQCYLGPISCRGLQFRLLRTCGLLLCLLHPGGLLLCHGGLLLRRGGRLSGSGGLLLHHGGLLLCPGGLQLCLLHSGGLRFSLLRSALCNFVSHLLPQFKFINCFVIERHSQFIWMVHSTDMNSTDTVKTRHALLILLSLNSIGAASETHTLL